MTILINSTSTPFGPPGQWIYINGEGFVLDGTSVLLDTTPVENLVIYNEFLLGFSIPTNDSEYLADAFVEVGTPTQPPNVESIIINDIGDWLFVTGENFVWDQTNVNFNGRDAKCFVYSTFSCGFNKNIDEVVESLILTTPNGSVTFNA